jgi:SAM-dependent methyltransferase
LDIGTGDGAFLAQLVANGFDDVIGVEPSAAPVAAASAGVRSMIRTGAFDPRDFTPEQFGLVTCFQTLEHVPDPLALCRGAYQLLRPGGAFLVVCHNRRGVVNRLLGRRSPIYDVEHLQLFCPRSLRSLLQRSGLSDIRLRPIVNRYPIGYWMKLFPFQTRSRPGCRLRWMGADLEPRRFRHPSKRGRRRVQASTRRELGLPNGVGRRNHDERGL